MSQGKNKLYPNFPLSHCPTPYSTKLPILSDGFKLIMAFDHLPETQSVILRWPASVASKSMLDVRHYFYSNAWPIQKQALI